MQHLNTWYSRNLNRRQEFLHKTILLA